MDLLWEIITGQDWFCSSWSLISHSSSSCCRVWDFHHLHITFSFFFFFFSCTAHQKILLFYFWSWFSKWTLLKTNKRTKNIQLLILNVIISWIFSSKLMCPLSLNSFNVLLIFRRDMQNNVKSPEMGTRDKWKYNFTIIQVGKVDNFIGLSYRVQSWVS